MTGLAMLQLRSLHEASRRYLCVRILHDAGELVPVERAVESHPEPAPVAPVRGHEKPLRVRVDEHLLHSFGSGTPQREASVAVMIRHDHHEGPLLADEERRSAVTQTLARLGQRETDVAELRQDTVPLGRIN